MNTLIRHASPPLEGAVTTTVPASLEQRLADEFRFTPHYAFEPDWCPPVDLERLARRRAAALAAPANTLKAWRHDWRVFADFVAADGARTRPADLPSDAWVALPAPPELIAAFIKHCSGAAGDDDDNYQAPEAEPRAPATVRRYLATIGKAHRIHGLADPTKDELVRLTAKASFRGRGAQAQAAPLHWADVMAFTSLTWPELQTTLDAIEADATARIIRSAFPREKQLQRAQALLLVGYNTMARREELVALDLEDFDFAPAGDGTATIRRSKTDQLGEGMDRYLSVAAVSAVRAWLASTGITRGAVFTQLQRNGQARLKQPGAPRPMPGALPALLDHGRRMAENEVNRVFKAAMLTLGRSPAEVANISGHSTRVGAAQDLRDSGMTLTELMGSGGWKDARMPARYTRKQATRRSGMAKMMAEKDQGPCNE